LLLFLFRKYPSSCVVLPVSSVKILLVLLRTTSLVVAMSRMILMFGMFPIQD
jgi:hypothetical protein